jgi:hypothetical protein
MGIIRCTCVYRLSSRADLDAGGAVISVALSDPWCPASELHARTRGPQTAAEDTAPR